jgi:hypothetical protein
LNKCFFILFEAMALSVPVVTSFEGMLQLHYVICISLAPCVLYNSVVYHAGYYTCCSCSMCVL